MIELEGIKKTYPLNGKDVTILKGINLFISKGEFVSIMGPSGSGKSTLSAILGCLSTPSAGTYKINGMDIGALPTNKLARLRNQLIGFVFQDFNLLSGLTAWENVALPLVYGGIGARERKAKAIDCLKKVGLDHKAHNKPHQLSGGQKQRVAIARALVNDPQFLFADEPCGSLDKKTGEEIMGIMQKLNMAGHTVVMVTHSPSDSKYSKRIVHLVDGNIVGDETVDKPNLGVGIQDNISNPKINLNSKLWEIAALVPSEEPSAIDSLKQLAQKTSDRSSAMNAAKALCKWHPEKTKSLLNSLFHKSDWAVKVEILKNLDAYSKEFSIPYLMTALEDENPWVRHTASIAIRYKKKSDFSEQEIEQIFRHCKDSDERVRATISFLLGQWQYSRAEEYLGELLEDKDGRVRANTIEALDKCKLATKYHEKLRNLLNDKFNRSAANTAMVLYKVDKNLSIATATTMLNNSDTMTRSSGAWLYGMIQPANTLETLLLALQKEEEEMVQTQLVRAIAKCIKDQNMSFKNFMDLSFNPKPIQAVEQVS